MNSNHFGPGCSVADSNDEDGHDASVDDPVQPNGPGGPDAPRAPVEAHVVDESASQASETSVVAEDLPPVVSRLVVEIRSDGRKTMARGAIEDVATGQRVAISADARSLVELSGMLVQSLGQTVGSVLPRLGRQGEAPRPVQRLRSAAKSARRLLGRRRRRH